MNRDPSKVGRARVGAELIAEVVNGFVEPISWKTLVRPFPPVPLPLTKTTTPSSRVPRTPADLHPHLARLPHRLHQRAPLAVPGAHQPRDARAPARADARLPARAARRVPRARAALPLARAGLEQGVGARGGRRARDAEQAAPPREWRGGENPVAPLVCVGGGAVVECSWLMFVLEGRSLMRLNQAESRYHCHVSYVHRLIGAGVF